MNNSKRQSENLEMSEVFLADYGSDSGVKRFKSTDVTQKGLNVDSDKTPVIRRKALSKLQSESKQVCALSPITEISLNFSDTTIGTPLRGWEKKQSELQSVEKECYEKECDQDDNEYIITNSHLRRARRLDMSALSCDDDKSMAIDEVSFYDSHSPNVSPRAFPSSPNGLLSPEGSPQRFTIVQSENNLRMISKLRSLDELDTNSMDSGYSTNSSSFKLSNRAVSAVGGSQKGPSPRITDKSPKNYRIYHSLSSGSMESMDDEYMDLIEMESLDDNEQQFPSDLNSLISGAIKTIRTTPEIKRPSVRRCLSLSENNAMHARSGLFEPKTPEILKPVQEKNTPFSSRSAAERCFKRPEPPSTTGSPIQTKRYKSTNEDKENTTIRPTLRKCVSMNDAHIMTALSRSSSEPDLIGDFSKPFVLPLMDGRHRDLKSISADTMAKLMRGEYNHTVASFKVIDCRYPYEFVGGHIRNAQNLYTHEQIIEELVNCKTEAPTVEAEGPKRHILVFHCEFSSERGPKLSRFLRNHDRSQNSNQYPALHYPEVYLLHGGYKEFFENYSELCDPIAYRPMLDPSYGEDLKHFRSKSKSWNGDIKSLGGSTNRLKKSRSRLVL